VGTTSLTVYFEDPFWVGVVEQQEDETLRVARHVFGSEPSPVEVFEFVLYQLGALLDRPAVAATAELPAPKPRNPKHAAREAAQALAQHGTSTQAQAAYKRQIAGQKAKARHRGR
jgi:hypothetical protein